MAIRHAQNTPAFFEEGEWKKKAFANGIEIPLTSIIVCFPLWSPSLPRVDGNGPGMLYILYMFDH